MKPFLCALALTVALGTTFAAPTRTIRNLPGFPEQVLKRMVSAKFYRSLLISPVEGYIVVSGHLVGRGAFTGIRVTHSELGGAYDEMALELARNFTISGFTNTDRQAAATAAQVHLLIYKIADGKMALSFPVSGESGGNQLEYYGSAWMAVQKDGKWAEIKGPELRRRR